MANEANALTVSLYMNSKELKVLNSTNGPRVIQMVDADSINGVDFRVEGRHLLWDYDSATDAVSIETSDGLSKALTRVGDYFRWVVQPDDLGGAAITPNSTGNKTAAIVVTRTLSGVPTRLASQDFTITLDRQVGFNPHSIAGLGLWLDAYSLTEAAGAVITTWDDKSPYDRDVTEATNKPARQNTGEGRPYALFDGTNDVLASTWAKFKAPCTLFVAAQMVTRNATVRGIAQVGGTNGVRIAFDTSNLKAITGSDVANTTLPELQQYFVATATKAAAGNATIQLGLNAAVTATSTAAVTEGTTQIGDTAADQPGNFGLFELLIYESVLSAANIEKVVRYLQKKWGTI